MSEGARNGTRWSAAIGLHATADQAGDVSWAHVRELAQTAEALGFASVVLPDHLSYRAGGDGDYALADSAVGARESMTFAAAIAAATDHIGIAHSVVNAPYRPPAMVAHLAASLADISGGRYELGIGVGNSFDYDQLGVAHDRRVARFEECVEIIAGLLHNGRAHLDGDFWSAHDAELVLAPADRVPLTVAAGGPRTMRVAARFGDRWNGFVPTTTAEAGARALVSGLDEACERVGRDPATLPRTFDVVVDPLNLHDARAVSGDALHALADLGAAEVRCWTLASDDPSSRRDALHALADLTNAVSPRKDSP